MARDGRCHLNHSAIPCHVICHTIPTRTIQSASGAACTTVSIGASLGDCIAIFLTLPWFLGNYDLWQWSMAIPIIPALVLIGGLCFAPESPRYLLNRGRILEAKNALECLVGQNSVELEFISLIQEIKKVQCM